MKPQFPPKPIALMIALILSASPILAKTPAMPFAKGTTWIYEGTVAWQEINEEQSQHIRLVTKIIETFSYSQARIAVVRSFPSELTWYGDKQHPAYSLLILSKSGL